VVKKEELDELLDDYGCYSEFIIEIKAIRKMDFSKYHLLIIILTFLFIGLSFYYPLANYDSIPERIPTHFNFFGEPDSWSKKNFANLLMGQIITSISLLFMFGVIMLIKSTKDPLKLINGPRKIVERMSIERAELIRKTLIFHLLLINFFTALLIMSISMNSVLIALGQKVTLGWSAPAIICLLLGDAIILVWKSIKLVYYK